jgi:hypothetical protein
MGSPPNPPLEPMVRPLAGWNQPVDGLPGTTWAKHSTPGEDTKARVLALWGRGRITRQTIERLSAPSKPSRPIN